MSLKTAILVIMLCRPEAVVPTSKGITKLAQSRFMEKICNAVGEGEREELSTQSHVGINIKRGGLVRFSSAMKQ